MKRYFIFFLFFLSYLTASYSVMAQSVLNIAQEEVTQPLDISKNGNIILLNMGAGITDPDKQAFYTAPNFDLLFRLKYNKATKDSWDTNWEATVRFKLIRIAGTYPANKGVLDMSEVTLAPPLLDPFDELGENNDGIFELKINQSNIEDVNSDDFSQVFVDYEVISKGEIDGEKLPFDRNDLHDTSVSDPFTTAIQIVSIIVKKGDIDGDGLLDVISAEGTEGVEGYIPILEDGSQDPIISFEVTPKPREVYGKVGNFVGTEELNCNTNLCYREEFEELVWKKIENAHFYDLEWVFIDKYDSKTITTATEAFANRRGVRIRTSDRHYLVRLGTELTYPEGRIFFRIRGVGKQKPTEDSEVLITTGKWNYGLKFLHLGADYKDNTPDQNLILPLDSPIRDNIFYKSNVHEENRNWQYATVFAEEGKYKKVMSYFDPSLRSTQTLTNFTTDASGNKEGVTLVEESFYDYEGRAVVQTIPAPLHTSSLAHQSVTTSSGNNYDRVNFFAGNDKGKYDNLANSSPALDGASLTASYYSANPVAAVDFSTVDKFKHQDFVPISNGFAYTQVRYTNDGTGRVKAQSGVGEAFQMGGGKEVKTFYLNPSEEELRRLFGNQLGDISHYKKVVTIDPNGQKSVAYIDQAGQTIATGLLGNSPEQLRVLEDANVPDFEENLIKSNQRKGTVSRTEHTFFVPETNDYTLDYSIVGTTTSLQAEGEELCLMCEYELEINIVDAQGKPINGFLGSSSTITALPHIASVSGKDIAALDDCTKPEEEKEKVNNENVTIKLEGLTSGEYTITKELRLTAGDATQISEFVESLTTQVRSFSGGLMTQTSERFRRASELAAAEKAQGDCLECTEVIEEDGTVTQLATSNNCDDPDDYLAADFHNLVTEQIADQCEADQNRYVLDPDITNDNGKEINLDEDLTEAELETNYNRIPLCILCVEDTNNPNLPLGDDPTELKLQLKNSYLYDAYMRKMSRRSESSAVGIYMDADGARTDKNFSQPISLDLQSVDLDPFWKLYVTQTDEDINNIDSRWNAIETELAPLIFAHALSLPSIEERREQSWLIFQGFYQNFKRAHLKVFYQKMTEDSECDPTAIDILLPELAGTDNIDLANLTLSNLAYTNPAIFGSQGDDDQWEQTWLGYTGTANCTDWAENMTVLLETKIGQCNGDWSLETSIRNEIKDLFLTYCNAQKGQPLANAFKKLYYSPYVKYTWLEEVSPLLDDQDASYYVGKYNKVITNNPTSASELTIAFEVHFGIGSLSNSDAEWDLEYSTDEQKELVRAYVESMIRAVSPTNNYAYIDYNEDGNYTDIDQYSVDIKTTLDAIKEKAQTAFPTDDCGLKGFYAMLSVPDCKTHNYEEVEVPADSDDDDDLPVLPTEAWGIEITKNGITNFPRVIHQEDVYHPTDNMAFMVEMTVAIESHPIPQEGDKIILLYNPYDKIFREGNVEVGYIYRNGGYDLYYHLSLTVKDGLGSKIKKNKTGYSTEKYSIEDIKKCHNLIITQDIQAKLENGGTQKIYRDGCLVTLNGISEVDGHLNEYYAELFPLLIASEFSSSPIPGFINSNANIKIKELRIWKSDENFTRDNVVEKFNTTTLEPYQLQNEDLLAYFTFDLDTYIDEGELIRLKDKSQYAEDMVVSQFDRDEYQSILRREMSCLLEDCNGNIVKPKTVKKFLYTCDQAYTFGDGVDLWGGRPLTPPTAQELQEDCERVTKDLLDDYAERLLVKQREAIEAKIDEEYRNQCFNSPFKEEMTLTYAKKEYHYTLYYYDQAGNLVQTVPPEGVTPLTIAELKTNENLELNSPAYKNPIHFLKTKYTYNTLGQVVWQKTPDAGESKFWIDYYGRVKLSQNAEQEKHNDYAYSKFDELGRPYEVGKLNTGTTSLNDGQVDIEELTFDSDFPIAIQTPVAGSVSNINFTLSQRTKTFYDVEEVAHPNGTDFIVNPNEQKNLKNRVAAVAVIETGEEFGAITRYSYDIHGNVEKLWQKMPEETGFLEKTVEYNYDLLSGKVNEVIYNRGGEKDEFRHRYSYDGDNRLTEVETSLDGYHWTREASYFYYAHGPLARIETGQHNIQGTDYFYTLQGWIKGVNSIGLNEQNDLAKDGAELSTFSKDEYAYTLNYFEGDYNARAGNIRLGETFLQNEVYANFTGYQDELNTVGDNTYKRESLYNGNIAAMATSIRKMEDQPEPQPITQSMNYRYDQLHRIAAAEASTWNDANSVWQGTNGGYRTSYKYDRNGNIDHLKRYNGVTTPQLIDDLTYTYYDHIDTDPIKNPPLVADRLKVDMQNRLWMVNDENGTAEGLGNTGEYKYEYDLIGNLTKNTQDGIENIVWNIYGKVERVEKTNGTVIRYKYDGTGNRIFKEVHTTTTHQTNYYLRDASGNTMAIYETINTSETPSNSNIAIKEIPIYGSSRLGQYRPLKQQTGQVEPHKKTALGQRIYEFSNHLGNVLVTLNDFKVPNTDGTYKSIVLSASDYYPFGMAMKNRTYQNSEYRYGFNGMEKDWDIAVGKTDFGGRIYDEVTGRWFSCDPLEYKYPSTSTYNFAVNNPLYFIDIDGEDIVIVGKNGSSISVKTSLIDFTADASTLGFDFGGNFKFEGADMLEAALDIAGIFDPTGSVDAISTVYYAQKGDTGNAFISGISMIPFGDALKLFKLNKHYKTIMKAVNTYKNSKKVRKISSEIDDIPAFLGDINKIGGTTNCVSCVERAIEALTTGKKKFASKISKFRMNPTTEMKELVEETFNLEKRMIKWGINEFKRSGALINVVTYMNKLKPNSVGVVTIYKPIIEGGKQVDREMGHIFLVLKDKDGVIRFIDPQKTTADGKAVEYIFDEIDAAIKQAGLVIEYSKVGK
ncbi:RHS repeat-associated core domain-containing protein [Bernardetia sp. MNP-M8]|uniref:RHS repeat-associated core domain-containing protein n=1 Tax=Bernardetia sp. MNP-M8 TaxID=3127470 RepID=UPI0030D2C966